MNTYDIGDVAHLTSEFINTATGNPIDPSTVTLVMLPPDKIEATFTYPTDLTRDSIGNYHYDYDGLTMAGTYAYRFTSTGTGKASAEKQFQVRRRKVS